MALHFAINEKIVAEEFDNEIVLIDVEKGLYFSLQGAAVDLWRAFATERAVGEVLGAFTAQVAGSDQTVLQETIGKMQENGLLTKTADQKSASAPPISFLSLSFVAPVLEVYSDLAELIAIDPVHEVDATSGWPLRPANFPDVS
jgi:hypothetical protein